MSGRLITIDERAKYRATLTQLDELIKPLVLFFEKGTPIDPTIGVILTEMTNTGDPVNQLAAMRDIRSQIDKQFDEELRYAGQFQFSPFCEYIRREEPPAFHHEFLIEHMEAVHRKEIMRLAISLPPGSAKALCINTPIPTPNGWKTMGELKVGDKVFDENGLPCDVTAVSPFFEDRPSYKVTTDCGDEIIADRDHEWKVRLCGKHPVQKVKETHELCRRRAKRPMITRAKALELPEADLPIDPYVLGLWLGDGSAAGTRITCHPDDQKFIRPEFERLGYHTTTQSVPTNFGIIAHRAAFVSLGLLNDPAHSTHGRKHIPAIYMRASTTQRLHLLQGLIDSDGTVCKTRGCTTFCNTSKELALQVRELVQSLGVKAGWSESRATLYNKDCGAAYKVSFYLKDSARLPRKAALTRDQKRTPNTYIDVTRTDNATTRCIEVNSPSHLFLCGRSMTPTHNSTYASIRFAAWHLGRRPDDRWLQGAHTQGFAKDRLGKPVRGLLQEDRFRDMFPDFSISSASSAADYFEFTNGLGYYKAVGVGVGISGYRADIGGIDDPIASREDAESPTIRRKLHEWFEDDFGTRPMPGSPIFVVQTRWHDDDLVGHQLQKVAEGKSGIPWEIINIPALAGPDDLLGRKEGEGLWPEVFGTDFYLEKKRSMAGRSWNSLYQGNPVDEDGGVLRREDVSRYTNIPKDEVRNGKILKKRIKRTLLSVDCAEKATQRSDYSAATVWIETTDKKHYLVHASHVKKEFIEMVEWIESIAKTWDVDAILVEDRGAGTQYIQVRQQSPGPAPVIPIATKQQSKEFRFDGVTPMFSAGEALLPESGVDWIADVEAELFAFPAGRNDDYVDSVSQYLAYARERTGHRKGVRKIRSSTVR